MQNLTTAPRVRALNLTDANFGRIVNALATLDKRNVSVYTQYLKTGILIEGLAIQAKLDGMQKGAFYELLETKTGVSQGSARSYATLAKGFEVSRFESEGDAATGFIEAVNAGDYKLSVPNFGRFLKGKAESEASAATEKILEIKKNSKGEIVVSGELATLSPDELVAKLLELLA